MLVPVAVVLLPGPGDEDAAESEGGEGHHKGGHRPETQRLGSDIGDDSWNSRRAAAHVFQYPLHLFIIHLLASPTVNKLFGKDKMINIFLLN